MPRSTIASDNPFELVDDYNAIRLEPYVNHRSENVLRSWREE